MTTLRKFSLRVLKSIATPHPPEIFKPKIVINQLTGNTHWHPPKYSLRRQADMRKACILSGKDPESIGLPPLPEKKPLRTKPPKLAKHVRMAPERKAKIDLALKNMLERIKEWKEVRINLYFDFLLRFLRVEGIRLGTCVCACTCGRETL
ncbi:hypothetical protein BC936DRAFT_137541 [Jimgerdemannia flammicorona]|uniref:Large ribosomal subunit protein mL59 domain-containing protein n=1 Tax=Jimgerdemannia flammicorona TaxID=994334 RepID=A0A433CX44_9FUNG|nr:hypothetical protein BC936DRAFT_137541 [Jimgerdemannia flammicorona]